jgi:hypothetical protein
MLPSFQVIVTLEAPTGFGKSPVAITVVLTRNIRLP